jgi:hypothetical protein
MLEAPEEAAVLYVDGYMRVYRDTAKVLPKHYVARERLCLSATADDWVNAMDGKPIFVVSRPSIPGAAGARARYRPSFFHIVGFAGELCTRAPCQHLVGRQQGLASRYRRGDAWAARELGPMGSPPACAGHGIDRRARPRAGEAFSRCFMPCGRRAILWRALIMNH